MAKDASSLSDDLRKAAEHISIWASGEKWIQAVYLFGSRIKGNLTPSSDLDVAVELTVTDEGEVVGIFIDEKKGWLEALNAVVSYDVDLQVYEPGNDTRVTNYVDSHGIEIYRRSKRRS